MVLANEPLARDRGKFLTGLESSQLEVLTACADALEKLPPDATAASAAEQFALLRTIRRLGSDPREYPLRERLVKLLERNLGREFGYVFGKDGYHPQIEVIEKLTAALTGRFPAEAAAQLGLAEADLAEFQTLLDSVNWEEGDAARGAKVFVTRQCAQCHGAQRAVGPDLAGAARRFSRDDLFTAIVLPDRDVSPRYQTTLIQTTAGKVFSGLIVYDSVDGLILRNSTNQTFRIESRDIELRRTLNTSLMPKGLLKGLSAQELADLYAYMRSLGVEKQSASAQK
jgi:putative heme-binding domain-containing protein